MTNIVDFFSNCHVRTKLIALITLFLISLIILGTVVNLLLKSSQTVTIVASEHRVFTENRSLGIEHFYKYKVGGDPQDLEQAKAHFNKAYSIAHTFSVIDSILINIPHKMWIEPMYEIFKEGVGYNISKVELMAGQIKFFARLSPEKMGQAQEIAGQAAQKVGEIIQLLNAAGNEINEEELAALQHEFASVNELSETFTRNIFKLSNLMLKAYFFVIALLVIVLGIIVTYISLRISRSISYPVNKLADNFKHIASGNLQSSVNIDLDNEIGDLSKAFSKIQLGLLDIVEYSKKVASGDFSAKLTPKSDADELTLALNQMAAGLEEAKLKTEKEKWIQQGKNQLEDKIRGNYTVRELSAKIITFLSRFLDFEMGAVYAYDEVLEHLEFTGSVGLNAEEVQKIVKPGQDGLIGRAALQNSLQIIDAAGKYQKIYSSTGTIEPAKLYLFPLRTPSGLKAVIEFAAVEPLNDLKLEFLNAIREQLSVNIKAAVARFRNAELLDKTLEQAEALKQREEELHKNLATLKEIQEKLTREKALLDSMLHTIPDYVYFKDPESRFIRVSESMADLFGTRNSEQIIGKTDFDFHSKANAQKFYDEEQHIIAEKKGFVNLIREGIDENNQPIWTSVTKLPMYDDTGRCIGVFGITKNITGIKQLELEVKAQNDKLLLNQEELKTTNEELKSQEEELRVANEELAEQTKILRRSKKDLQTQQEELQVINEELELKTRQLEQQKNDIAEKNEYLEKAQEELVQKANELQQASQYKSEFLANMSHELRTPLNSLLILSRLLSENKDGNLTAEQVKSATIIQRSGKDLLELISEILDLSKIEAGKMDFDFNLVSVESIKTELEHSFVPVAENKGLTLSLQVAPEFPETLFTDQQRLLQILKNLLSNAFKFTASGGIEIHFGLPDADTQFTRPFLHSHNTCYIAVKDTGVGIPPDKLELIFEAFQQADGSISRKFGGTGLGLSISRELIRALGGEIKVESTENEGSVFTLFLPADSRLAEYSSETAQNVVVEPEVPKTIQAPGLQENTVNSPEKMNRKAHREAPFFIADDRESADTRNLVLIIHPEKNTAKELLQQCRKINFKAVVAQTIDHGILLAEAYAPKAIIVAATLKSPEEYQKLKSNPGTAKLPVHQVSMLEGNMLDELEELITPETDDDENDGGIERRLTTEFKHVLVVEDDPLAQHAIHQLFRNKDIIVHDAKTGKQAYELIAAKSFDCVILDLGLPDFSGYELLKKLKTNGVTLPNVVIHTARELLPSEVRELKDYSDSIVIKGVKSGERLMDEVSLFLHRVAKKMPKPAAAAKATPQAPKDSVFKGKKILLVDDDIRNVFALAQILEEKGIEVVEAENGAVAIEVLHKNPDIDLVLMDIMMPVMDGYKAMKSIRETPEIAQVPIITLTAKAMKEDFQKAIDSGANDYISKPVDVDKLFELLKIWLFK